MRPVAFSVFVTVLAATNIQHLAAQDRPLSAERVEDLTHLQRWARMEQSFSTDGKRAALNRIQALLEGPEPRSDAEFYLQVASITALADNGHSNISVNPAYRFGLVPIRTFWFSDGMHIVRARSEYAKLLGARIDSIESVPVDVLVERLGEYVGGTDEYFRQYPSAGLMLSPAILHAAGIGGDEGQLTLSLEHRNGTRERVQLSTDANTRSPRSIRPWRTLVADASSGEGAIGRTQQRR